MIEIYTGDHIYNGPSHDQLLESLSTGLLVPFRFTSRHGRQFPAGVSSTLRDEFNCRVEALETVDGFYHIWNARLRIDRTFILVRYNDLLREGHVENGDLLNKNLTVTAQGIVAGGRVIGQNPQSTSS